MNLKNQIFDISSDKGFENLALEAFQFQYRQVNVYRKFCDLLKANPSNVKTVNDIPFLPIQFFKSHQVLTKKKTYQCVFTSSGTTGSITSKHYVSDLDLYYKSFTKAFELFFGATENINILALLPNYLERKGSSLIYMVDALIQQSKNSNSGFYLNDISSLIEKLEYLEKTNQKTILLGVSYALLDLIETKQFQLKNTIIMETGGMKGRRKEMVKEELQESLKKGFGVATIYSEYGMTELLSQAYSKENGIFNCPPWMKILTRDTEDAQTLVFNKTGGINVIDLANINSCSFIATQDLGKVQEDGSFEILGRFDDSNIRGCNLMVL
ncbi:MAG: acyl transferase [Flavobacteriaceae bacterium]|nr:acyl transferase [Flavobacteriaceae bacterium]MBT3920525.1 acyl transferase [Flavobacteriaceae bacterium]MBT6704968.1 acyl transferase [Flavobacteriaceae bacterium]